MSEKVRKKLTLCFWAALVLPVLGLATLILAVWATADIPSIEELENPDSKLATQVLSDNGDILTTYHIENRTFVNYNSLAPSLVQAAVATEDKRFYEHSGIDLQSLGRVLVKTLLSRDSSQGGGSTITQQLAKTLYPRQEGGGKLGLVFIKIKEWITAVKLERNYTKDEIMVLYFNAIFYGSNSYGISSAANQFFGKHPSELLTEESAMLVGMVNKPTRYNPSINPENALKRRNLVLERMCETGYIGREECDSLQQTPIVLHTRKGDRTTGTGPYFRDMLRKTLSAQKPQRKSYYFKEDFRTDSLLWADDPLYGWLNKNHKSDGSLYDLDRDGLRIYTTINTKMQVYAEEAIAEHLGKDLQKAFFRELKYRRKAPFMADTEPSVIETTMKQARRWSDRSRMMKASGKSDAEILESFKKPVNMRVFAWNSRGYVDTLMTPDDSIRYYKSFFRAAFMAIEPGTGHVKAYVGGPDYRYFKYDNVRQGKRQVGSTVKPFIYTLAMESGMTPCDKVLNSPVVIVVNGDETWSPQDTHADGTVVDLTWGLAHSSNSISAYLMKKFGAPGMVSMMRKMGINGFIDPVVSLCVGAADLSVFDMVTAYNTYPSGGTYTTPMFVTRIEDREGNILAQFTERKHTALSRKAAGKMIGMMRAVVDSGTGIRLRFKYGLSGEIAGKTGTTNDNSDGWFIGYTPKITAGVWVGAEDRYVHFENNNLGQGANMALPIWGIWMKKVLADGTLGISAEDVFPEDLKGTPCMSEDDEDFVPEPEKEKENLENYYFE